MKALGDAQALERFLISMVAPIAETVATNAAAKQRTSINEPKELAPAFRTVRERAVAETPYRAALPGERSLRNAREWPAGNIDELISGPGGPACVELKCRSDKNALSACSWDVVKMALVLRLGRASVAYLLAATTRQNWTDGIRGSEFFGEYRVEKTESNRRRFADWWRHWEKLGDPLPIVVPAAYASEIVVSEGFVVDGAGYELRLARVTTVVSDDYDWPPFLSPEERG